MKSRRALRYVRPSALLCALALPLGLGGCGEPVRIGIGDEPEYRRERPADRKGPPPWAPAHGYRAKHRYRYYPSSEVYYDEGRGVYMYYSGGSWRVSVSLPSGIRLQAGEYVTLEMDTDRPYAFHSDVRKHYPPGKLKKTGKGKRWKK